MMAMNPLRATTVVAIFVLALLGACQGLEQQAAVPTAVVGAAPQTTDETIVLGKVTVTSPAAPQDWSQKGSIWKPPPDQFNIILLRDGENTPIRHQLTDDGSFFGASYRAATT